MFRVTKPIAEHFGKWTFDNTRFIFLKFALHGAYPDLQVTTSVLLQNFKLILELF